MCYLPCHFAIMWVEVMITIDWARVEVGEVIGHGGPGCAFSPTCVDQGCTVA
jgi:hypothetical protein